jgi:thiamine biosynthesis lipoprotein
MILNEPLKLGIPRSIFLFLPVFADFILFADESQLAGVSGFTMGTSYEVQYVSPGLIQSDAFVEKEIARLLEELDRKIFTTYSPNSELSRFNQAPVNLPLSVSEHLLAVLRLSKEIFELSDGAFDITVAPLVNLWGFGPEKHDSFFELPPEIALEEVLLKVGLENLFIDDNSLQVTKASDIKLDLSGVAKGYAVDQVARLLSEFGVESYFVEVGGEIKIKGLKPDSQEWTPAIEAPVYGSSQLYAVLRSLGEAISLAGSGDYRNYYEREGIRYSHEIDPRSGRPITHNLAAAFVIDESAARADALATAFMVLGPLESEKLILQKEIKALLIYRSQDNEFQRFVSDGFSRYMSR